MGDIWEYYDEPIDIAYPEPRARDPKTDEAKARLVTLFEENPERLYSFGYEALAKRVRDELGLKVDCPSRIADGTMERLVKAHQWQKGKKGGA